MATKREPLRAWWAAALVLTGLVFSLGCNPFGTIAFLLEPERNVEPKFPLADKENDKEVKVVVLCYHSNLEDRPELAPADRELASKVVNFLEERFKENKEKVKIVHPSQVKTFMSRQLNWHTMSRQEIGKQFGADYVINIELNSITLYERGSHNQLYHGKANLNLTVTDVNKPLGEGERWSEMLPVEFPKNGNLPEASSMTVEQFRNLFLTNLGRNIGQRFASYPPRHRYDADGTD